MFGTADRTHHCLKTARTAAGCLKMDPRTTTTCRDWSRDARPAGATSSTLLKELKREVRVAVVRTQQVVSLASGFGRVRRVRRSIRLTQHDASTDRQVARSARCPVSFPGHLFPASNDGEHGVCPLWARYYVRANMQGAGARRSPTPDMGGKHHPCCKKGRSFHGFLFYLGSLLLLQLFIFLKSTSPPVLRCIPQRRSCQKLLEQNTIFSCCCTDAESDVVPLFFVHSELLFAVSVQYTTTTTPHLLVFFPRLVKNCILGYRN